MADAFVKWLNKNYYCCEGDYYPYDERLGYDPWETWCELNQNESEIRSEMFLNKEDEEKLEEIWEKWLEESDDTGNREEFHKMLKQNGFKLAGDGVIIKYDSKGDNE